MNGAYDMYDQQSSRSPGRTRHQTHRDLNRQPSRQFAGIDGYGTMPSTLYQVEENGRFDAPRGYDRYNQTIGYGGQSHNEYGGASAWNSANFGLNSTLNPTGNRLRGGQARGRSNLPQSWTDAAPPMPNVGNFSGLGAGNGHYNFPPRHEPQPPIEQDDLIPTAIVIKNIPFAVKKEQLVDLMTSMNLPLPYAFNYHFDNHVFRGLAFANFTTAEETEVVIQHLNHFELHGRKLRVEYKKMLPQAERERIEREKRERRGQLEEQHRPLPGGHTLTTQASNMSLQSGPGTSPSPVGNRNPQPGGAPELDLNNPEVLRFYSDLLIFQNSDRDQMAFPPTLPPTARRVVHTLAHQMGLVHVSKGQNENRQIHIFKVNSPNMSPPIPQQMSSHHDSNRRTLNRAATTDFSDVRAADGFYNTLGRQGSGFLGGLGPDSPGGLHVAQNLRAAKSYVEMRSYTPSPVPSTASFPPRLDQQHSRFAEYAQGASSSSNPNLTPTASTMNAREESLLLNGLNGMNLGAGLNTSPNRSLRGMASWDSSGYPAPIGAHRSVSTAYDDQSRDRSGAPARQPRGPMGGAPGFARPRQNGHLNRGSDDISSHGEIDNTVN